MSGVTQSEVDVIRRFALGRTAKEIASSLHLSHHTIHAHLSHAYAKTGVTSQVEMVAWALRRGVITVEELKKVMPGHGGGGRNGR